MYNVYNNLRRKKEANLTLAKSIHYRLSLAFSYRLNGERGYARMTRKATKPQTEELQLYKYFFYCFLYISLRIDIFFHS